ncbi:hypothetical protein [Enterobacter cloacae]|uniref:hypothetical protein n=1 Tax=Enterobacter cloacae TaxID=550 RepID=UPI0021473721|nr:hypothetical protein [Enterobacter cloacae]
MINEKNNVFYCDCGFSFQRGHSGAHDCADGLRIKLAESEARCAALAAENAGLKAGIGFFSYDSSGCYEEHDTAEKAVEYAEDSISEYRDNAPDGWSDEVGSVVWGVIMQRATMTGLRPVTEEDNVAPHIEEFCDYTLLPNIETPATDAFLAEVRAQGVEMFAQWCRGERDFTLIDEDISDAAAYEECEKRAEYFAAQLRKGVQS